jgi:N utilization substance protein B
MQTLYTLATLEPAESKNAKLASNILDGKLARTLDLFTTVILYVSQTAQYAETDAANRSAKYLPTQEDLNVNTKIAQNTFLANITGSASLTKVLKENKAEHTIDAEWIKKLYQQLEKSAEYKQYIETAERDNKSEKAIIQHIWEKEILGNEALQGYFADEYPDWEDDKDMINVLMENAFKNNFKIDFTNFISAEKKEYAHSLLHTVADKEEYCMSLIQPKLKNWDAERVALIDLLLLRMGVCELLYFPTIPTKVTINEYIEIAKQYSTPQSAQFVNGVLDNILKEQEKENKINKQDRGRKA